MVISPQANAFKVSVPAFQALPSSVSRISSGQIVHVDRETPKPIANNVIVTEPFLKIHRIDVSLCNENETKIVIASSTFIIFIITFIL